MSGANLTDANSVKGVFKSFQSEYSNHVDVSSVGTKCAYHEKADTLYVATDPSVITAYSLEENKEIGTLKLQHAIYKMMQVDGHVVVIEKENGHFYVETPDCARPSEITITGENTLFAGDHGSCQVKLNSRLQVPYTLESSDPSVVSVSQNKSLFTWKAGEAAICVKTDDGINTYIPCESGSLRMAEAKGNLYIHTCHQMYQGSDGLRHQSNMTFVIQEDDMSLTDAYTDVRNLSAGYVSHSFNQFIRTDGDSIFRVDHGDATPRGIAFTQTKTGDSVSKPSEYGSLVRFKSGTGNYTGASIGGYEISDSSHLVAYNMDAGSSRKVRNVYIAAKEKDRWKTAVRQITNYADDGTVSWYVTDQEGLSLYTVNPYILDQVKDTCLVSFNTNGKGTKPDAVMIGKGKVLTAPEAPTEKNYIFGGWYTDSACREAYDFTKPIESDMMLYAKWTHVCAKGHTWEEGRVTKAPTCTEQGEKIRFCSICGDEKTVTVPAAGHHYQLIKVEDGLADVKCEDCGKEVTGKVPIGYRAYWKKAESSGYYYSGIPNDLEDPDTDSVAYLISGLSYSASSDQTLDEFVVESSDPENCKIDMSHRQIHFSRLGSYTITVYPKFNPTLKKEYTFVVAKPVQAVDLKTDKETVFAGKTVQLTAEAEGGKGTLTYRFVQIGADGSEKVLQESTERTYEFSAGAAGEYTIRTDVIDEGDSYKVTSSDTRSIHVTKPELVTRDHKSVQSAGSIIFGKKTAEIEVSGAVFVRNDTKEEVSGTFCFAHPDQVLSAGTHEVSWTFKPDNPDYYDIVRGNFPVEVKKAEQPAIIPPERISVPYSETCWQGKSEPYKRLHLFRKEDCSIDQSDLWE